MEQKPDALQRHKPVRSGDQTQLTEVHEIDRDFNSSASKEEARVCVSV